MRIHINACFVPLGVNQTSRWVDGKSDPFKSKGGSFFSKRINFWKQSTLNRPEDLHSSGNKHNNSPVFSHIPILQLNCTVTIDLLIPLENTQRLQLIFSWQIYRRWLYNFLSKCLAISCNQKKDWRHQQNLRMLYKGTHFKRSGDFTKSFQFTEISIRRKAMKMTTTKHVWCEWYIALWQDKNTSCFHFII